MIFGLASLLIRIFGFDFAKATRIARFVVVVLFAIVLLVGGLWLRSCFKKTPKIDEKAVNKAQNAIAKQDREQMVEVLAESDTKEDEVDSNIKGIEHAREEAKKNYSGKSNEELAAELEKRLQQP
jgi:low affinity Fe/Cu permease